MVLCMFLVNLLPPLLCAHVSPNIHYYTVDGIFKLTTHLCEALSTTALSKCVVLYTYQLHTLRKTQFFSHSDSSNPSKPLLLLHPRSSSWVPLAPAPSDRWAAQRGWSSAAPLAPLPWPSRGVGCFFPTGGSTLESVASTTGKPRVTQTSALAMALKQRALPCKAFNYRQWLSSLWCNA